MDMIIKVLGSGCANCGKLEELARQAAEKLGIDAEIVKVTEYPEIMAYGVMSTPALVIDDELKFAGRVPSLDEVTSILQRSVQAG
jgi:small redox-active disulfide protein 2